MLKIPSCKICFHNYNHYDQKPVTLITCCHTVCMKCSDKLNDKKCPICRNPIEQTTINWELLNLIPIVKTVTRTIEKQELKNYLTENKNRFEQAFVNKQQENSIFISFLKDQIKNKTQELIKQIELCQNEIINQADILDSSNKESLNKLYLSEKVAENKVQMEVDQLEKNTNSNGSRFNSDDLRNSLKIMNENLRTMEKFDFGFKFNTSSFSIDSKMLGKIEITDKNLLKFTENHLVFKTKQECLNVAKPLEDNLNLSMNKNIEKYFKGIQQFHIKLKSEYEGLGMYLNNNNVVIKVEPNSPAEASGLKKDFKIIEINGIKISNMDSKKIRKLLKKKQSKFVFGALYLNRYNLTLSPEYKSFGLAISSDNVIMKIEKNSPAFDQNLKLNDVVLEIERIEIKHLSLKKIKELIFECKQKGSMELLTINQDDFFLI